MEWVKKMLPVIGYTNHVMSPEVLVQKSQIQSDGFHKMIRQVGTLKSSQKDNLKITDIFFCMPASLLNSTLYTGKTVY